MKFCCFSRSATNPLAVAAVLSLASAAPATAEAGHADGLLLIYGVFLYQLVLPPIVILKPKSMEGRRIWGALTYLGTLVLFWGLTFLPMAKLFRASFSGKTTDALLYFITLAGPWVIVLLIYNAITHRKRGVV